MEKKYIFFDIDGTLTNDNPGGIVLESTKRTLKKLRENGHFVALATGRAEHFARPFALENGFDNMVSDGGNGVTLNGVIQWVKPLDRALAKGIMDELFAKGIPFAAQINNVHELYCTKENEYSSDMPHVIKNIDSFDDVPDIFKIFIKCTVQEEENLERIHDLGYVRYHDTDLIVEPLEKYVGIKDIIAHYGADEKDVVVFGDGKNDLSMISLAATSIAMGNAIDELKEIATFITKSNKDDGIEYACKHFGWID